eukprot:3936705-Rhodomonas_salina.2
MREFGMHPTMADDCGFSMRTPSGEELHVMMVVDDMIQVGNSKALLNKFLEFLRKDFTVTDDGEIQWFLGVNFSRDEVTGAIQASQTAFLDLCLEKYDMLRENVKVLPMEQNFKLTETDLGTNPNPEMTTLFRSMVGSLMYLSVWTRPDISYAVNVLARHLNYASPKLIRAARRIFQYLKGTRLHGITFYTNDPSGRTTKLYAYSDASDADDPIARRTTGGYIVFYNGSPVAWSTGLLRLTTLSTCESEYVQAALAAKEILYL